MNNKKISRLKKVFSTFSINKRQKFVIAVIILSLGLFISEHLFGKSGFFITIFLSLASALLFLLIEKEDIKGKLPLYTLVAPLFLYTLSIGLFYFLVPARFISRVVIASLYAFGLYSLFLAQNIFVIAFIRNIPLLSGARTVSFVITVVSYFFLSTVIFSLHWPLFVTLSLVFIFSALFIFQSIGIILEKSFRQALIWAAVLSLCVLELTLILWFWPTTPLLISIFLTGFFYTIVGLSQVWLDRRLFRGVLWEYVWMIVLALFILVLFTSWGG